MLAGLWPGRTVQDIPERHRPCKACSAGWGRHGGKQYHLSHGPLTHQVDQLQSHRIVSALYEPYLQILLLAGALD